MSTTSRGVLPEYQLQVRVRYQETDGQGRVHHSNYLNYFEIARVEMLRASGLSYKEVEEGGIFLVVTEANCRYFRGAQYDDLLTIEVRVAELKKASLRHEYRVLNGDELVAEGHTVVAAVTPAGRVVRLPEWCRLRESVDD